MCVFVGTFSREAAEAVCGVTLKMLLGLSNKSWLQQVEGHFQLHALMRQYGRQLLEADESAWRDARNRQRPASTARGR